MAEELSHFAGDVEVELPEGMPDFNTDNNRIRPSAGEPDQEAWASTSRRVSTEGGRLPPIAEARSREAITLADGADQLALAQQQQQKGLQVCPCLVPCYRCTSSAVTTRCEEVCKLIAFALHTQAYLLAS